MTTTSQDLKGSTVGGQTNLSTQLTEKLLDDYDQKLAMINKKDKNFIKLWEKVLEKYDKKSFTITSQK